MIGTTFTAAALNPSPDWKQSMEQSLKSRERFWNSIEKSNPPESLGVRSLFDHALLLCEARMRPERLPRLFDLARTMQDREPASRTYGNFRWYWRNDRVMDHNAVDFCMQLAALIWMRHQDWIPEGSRAQLKELMELGTKGCMNHRVAVSYTNIAMMNAQNLILLGEALGNKEAADEGYRRLERQILYIWENGIHEYDSPTYYAVDLDALGLIEAYGQRESGKAQARALLELMWTDIACNWFAPAGKLGGTQSRTYDYLKGLGGLDQYVALAGWLPQEKRQPPIVAALTTYRPPAALRELNQKRVPRVVRQMWGEQELQFKTHYVCSDVSLGTSGANYWNMDMGLTFDLPGPREQVRGYFIPDGRHDPYGKVKIPEGKGPHEKTLHLKPFFAASQETGDAAAIVIYREGDIPEGTTTLESHIVMPRDMDGFWVGDKKVNLSSKIVIPVKLREPVILRKGSAAVGMKVAFATGCNARAADITLENDANTFGAARLTINHHGDKFTEKNAPRPAAGLVVRIGSQIKDDAAFKLWKKEFDEAACGGEINNAGATLVAQKGMAFLKVTAIHAEGVELQPKPSRVVLELDGEDVGRKILQKVDAVKKHAGAIAEWKTIEIDASRGAHLEAETALLSAPFESGDDPAASGGKYVWVPPGERNTLGYATWKLKFKDAGQYYVWGRVLSPTSENDSFFVRATIDGKEAMSFTAWPLGTRKTWTWVRFLPGDGKEVRPVYLTDDEVRWQLKPREDGAKIDRWYFTTQKDDVPK